MDRYSLGDEDALPPEVHLPSFSESQGLNCSDTLDRDLRPSARDLLYAGLSGLDLDPSLPAPDMPSEALEDNLDTLSLYSGKDSDSVKLLEEYADPESQASLQDLGPGALKVPKEADEGGRAASGSARKGKRQLPSPQNPLLDCSLCGKVFSSASSLSKHYLTHSQERKHVCKICGKAFKPPQVPLTDFFFSNRETCQWLGLEIGSPDSPYAASLGGRPRVSTWRRAVSSTGDTPCTTWIRLSRVGLLGAWSRAPPGAEEGAPPPPPQFMLTIHQCEGSPARRRKATPAFPREASPGGTRRDTKGGLKTAPAPPSLSASSLDPPRNPDISSLAKQLRSTKGTLDLGDIISPGGPRQTQSGGDEPLAAPLPGKQAQAENGAALGAAKGEKSQACARGGGYRLFSGNPRSQRFSGFRKEKLKMDMCCAASPSQVAMASFSSAGPLADPPQDSKSKLTIFNRIQGGNIYRLPHPMKEENVADGCQRNGGPADWAEPRSTYVCNNCRQMFYTEKGLSSHMCFHSDQWPSPRGQQERQVKGAHCKSLPGSGTRCVDAIGQEKDGEDRDSKESSQHRKRKKRPQPKALLPGLGGWHQSCLRSPVFLVDRLLKGLFQCSPYTPPPMLSPIREGSGLYFNTLCSTSAHAGPDRLISSMLDQVDGSFGICMVKDDAKISIEPHINIGSRFQAEIPELQERSLAGVDEHVASLVWKPWGDVMTNPETQDRVTELCNVACSSVMPGGGTNLELALHCLHEAQGSVQVALETLLLRGPQKPQTHPLADYRYTGSDIWTPMEKRLFKKAFCTHKKDFYLIHKTIQTKTVAQCVEYYYIWKKMIKFDCGRAPGLEKRVKREPEEADRTEAKVTCSPRERPSHRPTPEFKIKTKSYRRESILNSSPNAGPKRTPEPPGSAEGRGVFPCRECERVFDKIKSRNAHMKRHRLQDHVEPVVRVKWPVKPFQLKEDEEEEMGADIGPLQW
uniref:Zinc finger protein 541 n=1 Tax=Panthera tigris altaica TaxID=74533 RepID=A0A8C9KC57_PANTA